MRETHLILTSEELAVLLAAAGGAALYGFWAGKTPERGAVLAAANRLVEQGLLSAGPEGFQVPPSPVRDLLEPLRDPEWAAFLTPRAEERPQVCYSGKKDRITGCEPVLVQPGAVRLFSRLRADWAEELTARDALPPLAREFPAGQRREAPAWAPEWEKGGAALLKEVPGARTLLEFWSPARRRAVRRVLLCAPPLEALILTAEGAVRTNDLYEAVQLPPEGVEEEII